MKHDWQLDHRSRSRHDATFLPPAFVEETAWDILLALRSNEECKLSLLKLSSLVSAPQPALNNWLALFEERQLISGEKHGTAQELWAVLTPAGRQLLDHYVSVMGELQVGPTTEMGGKSAQ